jgi:nicotinate dehydrogenase subunit B
MSDSTQLPDALAEALDRWEGSTSRRDFLKASGLFVLSFSGPARTLAAFGDDPTAAPYVDPDFRQLDSWIVIHPDSTATFYVGKTDGGQGTGTAYRQLMCDELDLGFDKSSLVMGRTDTTVDQGGSGGSTAIERDSMPARRVAAEARRVLIELASERLGVPVSQLTAREGVVSITGPVTNPDPAANSPRSITYGQLVGGKRFEVLLTGNNTGSVTGVAKVKTLPELRITGQSMPRYDIPPKVDATLEWAVDARAPRMVHARNVKPPLAGAKLISIDESSVRNLPGFIRVVSRGNYVAVVCEREEQAIEASRKLVVNWERPATAPFPSSEELFDFLRTQAPMSNAAPSVEGTPDAAFASAAKIVEASYDVPFQGHTAIGPAHGMADPSDGQMTIHTNDMKAYSHRTGIATFLGMPREQVRVIWKDGPQLYGRTAADDAGFEAAFLAKELGRPVRMQWMRHEETAWDTKGPAFAFDIRGALDASGNLTAIEYKARVADYAHVGYNEPDTVLIGQLMGRRPARPAAGSGGTPAEWDVYAIPSKREDSKVVQLPLSFETPLRTANLRDPNGPQTTFAGESFIDELAAAARKDPIQFRLDLLRSSGNEGAGFMRTRSIAVVEAAAKAYGWDTRPSPKPVASGPVLSGRGVAYSYRGRTIVAVIAEVEVNRETGRVWVKRMACAHDCGLVINPTGTTAVVQGNLLHGLSRALKEEVRFDREKVLSVDWITHPTLRHTDAPERIDVVLVNGDPNPTRLDLAPYGAGEPSIRPMMAAVANAIHDATGVRLRRIPFRDERVLAELRAAGL